MMCIHIHFQEKKYFRKKTAEITRFDGTHEVKNCRPRNFRGIAYFYEFLRRFTAKL